MPLSFGVPAPDFTLPSTSGRLFSLSRDMQGRACILYFYPEDFTRICTREACGFSERFDWFQNAGITILGVSRDTMETHLKFKAAYDLPFHLLSDEDGSVTALYKATIPFLNLSKRITYLLDKDHKVAAVYGNMLTAQKHIDAMIKAAGEPSAKS